MLTLEIWAPRYSTGDCCILASKVRSDSETYRVIFTKAKHLEGNEYVLTGAEIKDNSVLDTTKKPGQIVYALPMHKLERFKVGEVL